MQKIRERKSAPSKRRKFAVIDCETDPFKFGRIPAPFVWGFYDGEHYEVFFDTEELIDFLRDENIVVYAHNGGKFDFHFLLKYVNKNEEILVINSRLVKARIGDCEIRDSYAILPVPLAAYKKDEIDYSLFEPNKRAENMPLILKYLKADCVYLYELITEYERAFGRNITLASGAMKELQKVEEIKINNSGLKYFSEFKPYYFGGRCEVIDGGFHKNLTYIDINSAYPDAMKNKKHPYGFDFFVTHDKKPKIKGHGFYKIIAQSYGAFCFREKTGLTFDWSGQKREFNVTGWELLAAIDTGMAKNIVHIEQRVHLETKDYSRFIDKYWTIRKTTQKGSAENILSKLTMNSPYGKMGANSTNYKQCILAAPENAAFWINCGYEACNFMGDAVLMEKNIDEDDMRFFNVATAASITGYVRSIILRALAKMEHPVYCDTDSFFFGGKTKGLALGIELGEWKLEDEISEAIFLGKKMYWFKSAKTGKEKIALKGGASTDEKGNNIFKKRDFERMLLGSEITQNRESPIFSLKKAPHFLPKTFKKTFTRRLKSI